MGFTFVAAGRVLLLPGGGQPRSVRRTRQNLVRADDVLVPFDVIPCRPAGSFLAFIEETLAVGHTLRAIRTVTTANTITHSA